MANLEDIPSVDLTTELLRRMKCATKPDKRLILVGNYSISLSTSHYIYDKSLSLSINVQIR